MYGPGKLTLQEIHDVELLVFQSGTKDTLELDMEMVNNYDLKDFWEWDQATDVWTRKADFGGIARRDAVGFSIGNKGYIGTGS